MIGHHLMWDIKKKVWGAMAGQTGPSMCPDKYLYVLECLRLEMLEWGHSSWRTIGLLHQRFWWPTLDDNVRSFIRACPACSHREKPRQAPPGLLPPTTATGSLPPQLPYCFGLPHRPALLG